MVETVGKKLNQARLKRGLTIDEAAHATKLRPDKIAALESDDYTRFANNIYAKGFLQIYARFLSVDVSDFARTIDNANPISVGDYQYLSNAPAPRHEPTQVRREGRKAPSLAPLVFFLILIGLVLAAAWGYTKYVQITGERLTRRNSPAEEKSAAEPTPEPVPAPAPAPSAATPAAITQATPVPNKLAATPKFAQTAPSSVAAATPEPTPNRALALAAATPGKIPKPSFAKPEPPKNSDQDFVAPASAPIGDATKPLIQATGINEVLVAVVKKTWVTVRKDDQKAPPIFEDYVYPSANPLKLKGTRFFIDARDPSVVQITKNGVPFAYQAPNLPVQ